MEESAFSFFDDLRQRHFPVERNFVPAHISLFHHLPGDERKQIEQTSREICSRSRAPILQVIGLRHLGKGVAFALQSPALAEMHRQLATSFDPWLTPQDRQPFRPHITVQNKAPAAAVAASLTILQAQFAPWAFAGIGLSLWRYCDGPWELLQTIPFAA